MKNILFILYGIIFFNGCSRDAPFLGANSISPGSYMTVRWYLKPEYKNSKSLGGSPKDYGASFDKIEYKYEEIFYEKTLDGRDDIVIPKEIFGQSSIMVKDLIIKMMIICLYIKNKLINISNTIQKMVV